MPRSWQDIKTEFDFQVGGVVGCAYDIYLRPRNKINLYSLSGKVAVVTGGGRGLGMYVVKKLLDCDMTVIVGVRDVVQAKDAVEQVIDPTQHDRVVYELLDVGTLSSVRSFAQRVKEKFAKIHILVNNAGIMNVPYRLTGDGFESQLAVNYLGHFLLTHLFLPQLRAAGTPECKARVVNVSSCVHIYGRINWDDLHYRKSYYPADAYAQSKLAQILFTRHVDAELRQRKDNVCIYAVHPGVVNTALFDTTGMQAIPWFRALFFKTPEEGSRTVVFAAISPKLEGKGGGYYSNCIRFPVHSLAKQADKQLKFFELSCKETRIDEFF